MVVKKYDTLAILLLKPTGSVVGGDPGKKSSVVCTMATVGPAARKLHQSMATHTIVAMIFLYHRGLGDLSAPFDTAH